MSRSAKEFLGLVVKNERAIRSYIRCLVPNQADAEDVMQDTLAYLWSTFERYDQETSFVSWSIKAAWFHICALRRRRGKDKLVFSDAFMAAIGEEASMASDQASDMLEALKNCLCKLRTEDRALISRRYEPGGCVTGIAEELGRPVQTVYSRLKRIRSRLLACVQTTMLREKLE